MKRLIEHKPVRAWGLLALVLVLATALSGCAALDRLTSSGGDSAAAAEATPPASAPTPPPVVVSTPAVSPDSAEASTGDGETRRLDALSLTYNGEIMADTVVPVVAEVAGQITEVPVAVGDSVAKGDLIVRVDSTLAEAQLAQAEAALEMAQSQVELATQEPNDVDVEAARAGVAAAQAAYNHALAGASDEDERMMLAQLRQAEAGVQIAQAQYDRIAGQPFAAMLPESLQLQQATLGLEAAQAGYDKLLKGATPDQISGAYAQLAAARSQLARLERGAEPAQIKAAEAGVKQAEVAVYLAQMQVDKTTIEASADGFIYQLDAVEGGMAGPGVPMAVIFSDDVKILIAIEEFRSQEVAIGQPVRITVDAYADEVFDGVISEIAPTFDHATRTVQVTVRPTGANAGDLKPGMFATVQLVEQ
ncbi:MAG: efflux RND transporter periplasmic adaptor subunit [Caldilineales bacterium]